MTKDKDRSNNGSKKAFYKNKRIQRLFIAAAAIVLAFLIVLNGATPRKYRVTLVQYRNMTSFLQGHSKYCKD